MRENIILLLSVTAKIERCVYSEIEREDFDRGILYYTYVRKTRCKIWKIDLNCEVLPDELINDILDNKVIKACWQAQTVRILLSTLIKKRCHTYLSPKCWVDIQTLLRLSGIPASTLNEASNFLNIKPEPCHQPKDVKNITALKKIVRKIISNAPDNVDILGLYRCNQAINDHGIKANREILDALTYLESIIKSAVESELRHNGLSMSAGEIKEHFRKKYGKGTSEDIYQLLSSNTLNETDTGLVCCLTALNSRVLQRLDFISDHICNDDRFRGIIPFYGNTTFGYYSNETFGTIHPELNSLNDREFIKSVYNIEGISVSQIPDLLSLIKGWLPRCFDLTGTTTIDLTAINYLAAAKLLGSTWRAKAVHSGTIIKELRTIMPSSVRTSRLLSTDLDLMVGNFNRFVDSAYKEQWHKDNPDIERVKAAYLNCALRTIRTKRSCTLNGITFDYSKKTLTVSLPTGHILNLHIVRDNGIFYITENGKNPLTGNTLFGMIFKTVSFDIMTKLVGILLSKKLRMVYYNNRAIVIKTPTLLPAELFDSFYGLIGFKNDVV